MRTGRGLLRAALIFLMMCGSSLHAIADTREDLRDAQREILLSALDNFDQAVSVTTADPARARQLYEASADGFRTLINGGVRSAALEYNLGNTYYRLDRIGRAIVHYRRALQIEPDYVHARANLDYARQRVSPYIEPAPASELARRLLFWHFAPPSTRLYAAWILGGIGWGLLAMRLVRWKHAGLLAGGFGCVLMSMLAAGSLIAEMQNLQNAPPAVVADHPAVLRRGRGEGYEPVFSQPLGPGVEVRIIEQRGGWAEVRLADDRTGWLPLEALARI